MVPSPCYHLRHDLLMTMLDEIGVDKTFVVVPFHIGALVEASNDHMEFNVLTTKVLVAHVFGVCGPHAHDYALFLNVSSQ